MGTSIGRDTPNEATAYAEIKDLHKITSTKKVKVHWKHIQLTSATPTSNVCIVSSPSIEQESIHTRDAARLILVGICLEQLDEKNFPPPNPLTHLSARALYHFNLPHL